ncbi:cytochrome P450 [Blastococcus sp. SYSU D00813]
MTAPSTGTAPLLDVDRVRELFDLRGAYMAHNGGGFAADPYPLWARLREQAPVHEGTLHDLTEGAEEWVFQGLPEPDRPHFTAFTYAACNDVYKDSELFASSPSAVDPTASAGVESSMLSMGGAQHRRYRALVQPRFTPKAAEWWMRKSIQETVDALVAHIRPRGRAELNVDFCAAIPVLTITGVFGIPVEQALDVRAAMRNPAELVAMVAPLVAARREEPGDDLISVLVQSEVADEHGVVHRLTDPEIYSFCLLLLLAGSGTTWKQMGITLTALLERPDVLAAVREDRSLLRPAIEEALRWQPTDPMFSRFVTADTDFHGVHLPRGAVVHIALGAANRDPARWDRPDEFDIRRPPRPMLAFGGGPHICLGMHVARAEMVTGIGALLDTLPGLRLDPDAEPPRYVGFYERGATAIPVLFDS